MQVTMYALAWRSLHLLSLSISILALTLVSAENVTDSEDDGTNTTSTTTTTAVTPMLCADMGTLLCRNGLCVVLGGQPSCQCNNEYLYGELCQFVDIQSPDYSIADSSITFIFSTPPQLTHYMTASYVAGDADDDTVVISFNEINMNVSQLSLTVDDLKPDGGKSIVCVLDGLTLDITLNASILIADVLNIDAGQYCVSVVTGYDGLSPFTKAAFGIGIAMGTVVFLMLLFRCVLDVVEKDNREKILAEVMGKLNIISRIKSSRDNSSGSRKNHDRSNSDRNKQFSDVSQRNSSNINPSEVQLNNNNSSGNGGPNVGITNGSSVVIS